MATNYTEVLQDICILNGSKMSPGIVNTAEVAYRKKKALLEQQEIAATKNRQSAIAFSIIALAMIVVIITLIINRK